MNIYALPTQLHTVPAVDRIVAVGVFDGVHIGHSTVLTKALSVHGLVPSVFTFENTATLKSGGCLQTANERQKILERLEFADLFEADFHALRDMSPADFVQMLANDLHAKAIVCGFNFRFGKGSVGDTALLQTLCAQAGIQVFIQPAVTVNGEAVSSTRIKTALKNGDMAEVLRLQGRPFTIHATVKSGQKLGRTIGSPTINQHIDNQLALPKFGVYAALAIIEDTAYPAVTNIGVRPTVTGENVPIAETYILDFDGNLYGKQVPVELIRFLRAEQKFPNIDALKQAIQNDAQTVRGIFAAQHTVRPRAILFDFDNTLSDRQIAYYGFLHDWLTEAFPTMQHDELHAHCEALLNASHYGLDMRISNSVFKLAEETLPWNKPFDCNYAKNFLKIAYPVHTTLFDDTTSVLKALKSRGYLLGILSNGNSRIQNAKLDVAGVRHLVDYVLIGGDEGIQKPNAEIFRRAALRLGVHPTDCVFVGDNPINDIDGAVHAGMRAIFQDFEFPDVTIDHTHVPHITRLSELLDLL